MTSERLARRLLYVALALFALVYARSMFVLPFGDDWSHIARAHEYGFAIFFPEQFFRPFERLVNAINYSVFDVIGPITIAACIATLIATAVVLFRLARRIAPAHPWFATLAACFFVAHPGNVASVIQIDTLSQCLAALFAVLCARYIVYAQSPLTNRSLPSMALLIFATLCAKETTVGLAGMLPIAAYVKLLHRDGLNASDALRSAVAIAVAVAAALAAYLLVRVALQAALQGDEGGRYAFTSRPIMLIGNALRLLGGSLFIGDSAHQRVWRWDARAQFGVGVTALYLLLTMAGFASYRRIEAARGSWLRGIDLAIVGLLLLGGVFPSMLLSQVSEQYLPGLTPFVALLSAAGLCMLASRWPRLGHPALYVALIVGYTAWTAFVIDNKERMHATLSARHWGLSGALAKALPACGAHAQVIVTGDLDAATEGTRSYSVFTATNGEVIDAAFYGMRDPRLAGLIEREGANARATPFGPAADASQCQLLTSSAEQCEILCISPGGSGHPRRSCRIDQEPCAVAE